MTTSLISAVLTPAISPESVPAAGPEMMYAQKKVLVLGLGESGLSMAHWLVRCGAVLRVADTREAPERLPQLKALFADQSSSGTAGAGEFISGAFTSSLLEGIDFIATSPGLSADGELAEIMPHALQNNIPVWSEIELFAQAMARLGNVQPDGTDGYRPKIIAITGTNGKTTVTSLVGLLAERAGKSVRVAGNISPAALDVLRTCLDEKNCPDVWVLELSSFQLHATYSLQADAATVLNLSQDHLDWHGSMAAYGSDKARIFSAKTVQVLNRDDAAVMQMQQPAAKSHAGSLSFGLSVPTVTGEFGLQREYGVAWLVMAAAAEEDEARPKRKNKNQADPVAPVGLTRLMPVDALRIRGTHNAMNALAALALCRAIGLPLAPLLHGLREYQGEPHRVELVATIDGVEYYDDSKGTNVGATVAAINGLAKIDARLLLIAGGVGKGQDFAPLAVPVEKAVKAVFLIGQAAGEIAVALADSRVNLVHCVSLEQAVLDATALACPGDMVLLSPACASFDMFKNYGHRAAVFIDAVKEIGYARGEVGL